MTSVSAVVVTWNSEADIEACLQALLGSEGVDLEVIVVDNASTDATVQLLEPFRGAVRLICMEGNSGYAHANIVGADTAGGDYLLLVNPDCHVSATTVAALRDHLDQDERCSAVSALLLNPDRSPQFFARKEPSFLRSLAWFVTSLERLDRLHGGRVRWAREYRTLFQSPPDQPFPVDCPAAACVLLRRTSILGPLFDESYPLFFNDVDLYRRLRDGKHSVVVLPRAPVLHGHGKSHRQLSGDTKRAEQVLSLRRYARAHWRKPLPFAFDLILRLDAVAALWIARRRPEERHFLEGQARGTLGALEVDGGTPPFLSTGGVGPHRGVRS